ncbi:sugar transferase [Aestuariivirga litoralis]|uniref:sugar transferase n=1 Tax=Aestuariivirga litoralis TaxID=2650924 RepID=UPI0018C53800|nr:sugar transferase [Aestuariivirga litoralis]MBG1233230.1 sugar transferase [Aestuariivirga litoralis]
MPAGSYRGKRVFDLVVAGVLLALLCPVLLVVALLVAMKLGRPVLFRQARPGRGGQVFTLIKFRSMKNGDGSDAERLTRFGKMLRASSLDELPELWNILRGDMSLVGPRPLLVSYLPLYSARQALRHNVRPGITGLAQVNGRNALGWDEKLELDVRYVETQGFWLDLRILVKTFTSVLLSKDVAAEGHATMPAFKGSARP